MSNPNVLGSLQAAPGEDPLAQLIRQTGSLYTAAYGAESDCFPGFITTSVPGRVAVAAYFFGGGMEEMQLLHDDGGVAWAIRQTRQVPAGGHDYTTRGAILVTRETLTFPLHRSFDSYYDRTRGWLNAIGELDDPTMGVLELQPPIDDDACRGLSSLLKDMSNTHRRAKGFSTPWFRGRRRRPRVIE